MDREDKEEEWREGNKEKVEMGEGRRILIVRKRLKIRQRRADENKS